VAIVERSRLGYTTPSLLLKEDRQLVGIRGKINGNSGAAGPKAPSKENTPHLKKVRIGRRHNSMHACRAPKVNRGRRGHRLIKDPDGKRKKVIG